MRTFPEVGSTNPAQSMSAVVLPDPLGPSSVRNSPVEIRRSTPRNACVRPYVLVAPRSSSADESALNPRKPHRSRGIHVKDHSGLDPPFGTRVEGSSEIAGAQRLLRIISERVSGNIIVAFE